MIGKQLGWEDEPLFQAAQYGLTSGLFAFKAAQGIIGPEGVGLFGQSWLSAPVVGIGVGIIVFILTYKEVEYQTISFDCLPWEAPLGGDDCEKCNDGIHLCTEYRCKSLGQVCGIPKENQAEGDVVCVNMNPKDVTSPIIRVWEDVLTKGYEYSNLTPRPPGGGTIILGPAKGCTKAFTPLEFGIQTNKPAQCKIDFTLKDDYDSMQFYFGESNLYAYNHSQKMNLPSPDAINDFAQTIANETGGLEIQNDGKYELYVRCRSANGFYNPDAYIIKFCVEPGPDLTPPIIVETSIRNNQPVSYEVDEVPIIVYTNEPATCRWSRTDQGLDDMENSMTCANNPSQMDTNLLYACKGTLTNIEDRKDNVYYFRCEDQPWKPKDERIRMTQSYKLTLKGTQPLNIDKDSVKPETSSIVRGATTTVPVFLELQTQNGYNNGEAECFYSADNETFISFFETNSYKHKQRLDLTEGDGYTYYIRCIDLGGNQDSTTLNFGVEVDTLAPSVVRILYDSGRLKIITDENATCYYSNNEEVECNYEINNSTYANIMPHEDPAKKSEHLATWDTNKIYYIKCKDDNDKQPSPTQCSAIISPTGIEVEDEED